MTLNKNKVKVKKTQPDSCETDVESCHENIHDARYSKISEIAYYKAEARGFEPGHELDDWIAAENEVRWY